MSVPALISKLEATNSRLNKESIVGTIIGSPDEYEFFDGAKLALNSLVTFGIKKIPTRSGKDGPGLDYQSFALALTGFINRSLTGNAAREAVDRMMAKSTNDQWNLWYRRILLKDLDCGMSEKTINKVCKNQKRKDLMVPVFSCQLAKDSEGVEPTGSVAIEVKLDGVRVITIVYPNGDEKATVEQYSRNGKVLENFSSPFG